MSHGIRFMLMIVLWLSGAWYPVFACDDHLDRANHYQNLRRAGGNARQMAQWQAQHRKHEARYNDCRLGDRAPRVRSTGRGRVRHETPDTQSVRRSDSSDPQVRKLLDTCNFWGRTYNRTPTDTHQSYRDTACRAFREAERRELRPRPVLRPHRRTLSECIKPANHIDNDVQACLEGRLEPVWNTH